MFESFNSILKTIDSFVWGLPLIILIISVGLFLTIRLKGLQITKLGLAIKHTVKNEASGDGEVSGFASLCTALSATIGTGNIVGVATALVAGGPGALFWMWIAALVGTATKYSECLLAVKYRVVQKDGHILGGPFYYIEHGMGKKWKWLAKLFAFFGVGVGLLGIGTFTQINGITSAVNNFFDANNQWAVTLFGREYSWSVIISGILLTIFTALVLIGGLKRISSVAQIIVPFMAFHLTAINLIFAVTAAINHLPFYKLRCYIFCCYTCYSCIQFQGNSQCSCNYCTECIWSACCRRWCYRLYDDSYADGCCQRYLF